MSTITAEQKQMFMPVIGKYSKLCEMIDNYSIDEIELAFEVTLLIRKNPSLVKELSEQHKRSNVNAD